MDLLKFLYHRAHCVEDVFYLYDITHIGPSNKIQQFQVHHSSESRNELKIWTVQKPIIDVNLQFKNVKSRASSCEDGVGTT